MTMPLPPFPIDDLTLVLILDALDTCLTYDGPDGERLDEPHRINGAFGLHELMDFYSGYDETKLVPEDDNDIRSIPMFTYPDELYTEHDIIRALIAEVRRCRMLHT
jgi:hypothetical protein